MNILIFGVSGLIGSTLARTLSQNANFCVYGTTRQQNFNHEAVGLDSKKIYSNINVCNTDDVISILNEVKPLVIINCAGITKHVLEGNKLIPLLSVNSIFPCRLSEISKIKKIRFVQISSDCVFSGESGFYTEDNMTDAIDLYGKSKALGEIVDNEMCITLRTSTIGHEINTKLGLLEWFLAQKEECNGYTNAYFSGVTTFQLSRVIRDIVIPNHKLNGLYNLASSPISKYDLLCIVAKVYKKEIKIIKYEDFTINRTLNGKKFNDLTGYMPPSWECMINEMSINRPYV